METFICYRCGRELPITAFSKDKSNKIGHSYWCKDCNKEYSKIYRERKAKELAENYEKAKADNFIGWHRHHRLATHNSDGERRLVQLSREELKALNMYYDRPAKELIWLTNSEHLRIHLTENDYRKRNRKSIVQYDKKTGELIAEYESIEEAKRQLGIFTKGSGINRCCKGVKKSAYGYAWRYKE